MSMGMNQEGALDIDAYKEPIVRVFPDLEGSRFGFLPAGWHSVAIEVEGQLVFKFPRNEIAEKALRKEAALLHQIRPRVSMPVPGLSLHHGPPLFSRHRKLEGGHLLAEDYARLPQQARERLGNDLARFYAELHALDIDAMKAAGAGPVEAWQTCEAIRAKALPVLATKLRTLAEKTLAEFEQLSPDPYGMTYGFFDGHGWNMAFDHQRRRLNGVYDFADSGIGPLHQDFIYSSFISPDLTARIASAYETMTRRPLDRRRIFILTGIHRLSELAELADDPVHLPKVVRHVELWAASTQA